MPDPRFFPPPEPVALGVVAGRVGAELADPGDSARVISGAAPLDSAGAGDLSFFENRKYAADLAATKAGAVILAPAARALAPEGAALAVSAHPYRAWARATQFLYPSPRVAAAGIAAGAHVDPTASLGPGCQVDPGAAIGAGAELGARCRVHANAVIGPGAVLGDDCSVGPCASLSHCILGDRVAVHPGARIGQEGFGFAMSADGHETVAQLGRVVVGDDVEIGANTTVDRGSGNDTVIGAGTRIDNLVQIAHNVRIGRNCVLAGQAGLAGSARMGDLAALAAQSGVAGHLRVGEGARVAARSGVIRDVPPGATVCGMPAVPIKRFFRSVALWNRQLKTQGKSR